MALPQTLTFTISDYRDADGVRISGESWDFAGCVGPNGAFTPTPSEPFDDGRYVFSHSAAAYGMYWFEAQAESDPDNPDAHFSAVTTVSSATSDAPTAQENAAAVWSTAVSGGDTGSTKAALAKTLNIGAGGVTVTNPIAQNNALTIQQGDAYDGDDALRWSDDSWAIPVDADIALTATYAGVPVVFAGVRVTATVVQVSLTSEQTAALIPGRNHYTYKLRADDDVLVTGAMSVERG